MSGPGLLLDTHALIFVSAASAWEIATKVRLGRLPGAADFCDAMPAALAEQGFEPLPVTLEDARAAGLLPGRHQDPFDRMLVVQALARGLALVSSEAPFDACGVTRLW